MSPDSFARMRQALSVRVVDALDLPGTIAGDGPRLDKYQLQSDPALLRDIAALVAGQLPSGTEVLAGVELGGATLAAAVALHTGLPWTLVRRRRGSEDPRALLAGTRVAGRATVIVKDMARAGGAISTAASVLRANGAQVGHAALGIDWNPELADVLAPLGITPLAALTLADLRAAWRSVGS